MRDSTWALLEQRFEGDGRIFVAGPVPHDEVLATIEALGATPHEDYVELVARYGGAMIGPDPLFGLRCSEVMGVDDTVGEATHSFRDDGWPGVMGRLVVSRDGRGNPVVLEPDGRLTSFDHDAGHTYEVAESLEAWILARLRAGP